MHSTHTHTQNSAATVLSTLHIIHLILITTCGVGAIKNYIAQMKKLRQKEGSACPKSHSWQGRAGIQSRVLWL